LGASMLLLRCGALDQLTLEDPNFHTNYAVGRGCLGESIINISPQGVQWHSAFPIPLASRHFRASETSCGRDSDAFGSRLQSTRNGFLHGAAEGNTPLKLLSDILCDKLGINLRFTDLFDILAWASRFLTKSRSLRSSIRKSP